MVGMLACVAAVAGSLNVGGAVAAVPDAVPDVSPPAPDRIDSSGDRSCIVNTVQVIKCWGDLGVPFDEISNRPKRVSGVLDAIGVAIGSNHGCALLADRTVSCWGDNSVGQLGRADRPQSRVAAVVPGLTDVIYLAAGGDSTCAERPDLKVVCWGANQWGQLGRGTSTPFEAVPAPVVGLFGVKDLSVGVANSCAIQPQGIAKCWGLNDRGSLGNGTADEGSAVPARVLGVSGALSIAVGDNHGCVTQEFVRKCWGTNDRYQLGDETTIDRSVAVKAHWGMPFGGLTAGANFTCTNDPVRCWGAGDVGQIGSVGEDRWKPIRATVGPTPTPEISAGRAHACALRYAERDIVRCWGANESGQLGRGSRSQFEAAGRVDFGEAPPPSSCPSNASTIPDTECAALVTFYLTHGPFDFGDWNMDDDPCTWLGVTCADGHVIGLHLFARGLSGDQLTPAVADLTALQRLNLSYGPLTGPIPAVLAELTELTELALTGNHLSGPIPPWIGDLGALEYLALGENGLTGPIPPEIGDLGELSELRLSDNQLAGPIPAELGTLGRLTVLRMSSNGMTSLPPEVGDLSALTELEVYSNQLTSIPDEIGNLVNLTDLDVGDNQLASLPAAIGDLRQLTRLSARGNRISLIPPEFGGLEAIRLLGLGANDLTALPAEIGNLTALEFLTLSENSLESLPPEIGRLSNLVYLAVGGNQLTALPTELRDLSRLRRLFAGDNQLSAFPAGLGATDLFQLTLSGNRLTSLPADLAELDGLSTLSVDRNQLTELPESIGDITTLTSLSASNNQLSTLPESIGRLGLLDTLALGHNQLVELPSSFGGLTSLRWLTLDTNRLTTPPVLPDGASFWSVQLHDNQMAGDITTLVESLGARETFVILSLSLYGNGCLTLSDPALVDWTDHYAPGWNDGCP